MKSTTIFCDDIQPEGSSSVVISLEPMQQLAEALKQDDDWTGMTSAPSRRKLQNRLNQRAYRRRKAKECLESSQTTDTTSQSPKLGTSTSRLPKPVSTTIPTARHHEPESELTATDSVSRLTPSPSEITNISSSSPSLINPSLPYFLQPTYRTNPNTFPLSTDHLLTLIRFNVYRACITNLTYLGLLPHPTATDHDLASPFNPTSECPSESPLTFFPHLLPPALLPTTLQKSIPHDAWIDLFPHPILRDNLIRAGSRVSASEICTDIVGCEATSCKSSMESNGVIVWSEAWDPRSWEVTQGFVRKWGWLLGGCGDLIEASNWWRARRDEPPLVVGGICGEV